MSNKKIFEDAPAPAAAVGGARQKIEKQARQLAYDTRYKVKQTFKGGKTDPAAVQRAYMSQLQKSNAPAPVKLRAKQMLMGEDYISDINDMVAENVSNCLFKVFVENIKTEDTIDSSEYLQSLAEMDEKKYKVRVTDKNSGSSYVRYATREKINQLRANPNIKSVEMTEYGTPYEGERNRGTQTAKATSGKGLDPVGREDNDPDNDGEPNDPNDKYIMKRRAAIGKAIATRKEEVEFIDEVKKNKKKTDDKVDVMVRGKNEVKVFPEIKVQEETETGYSKFLKKVHSLQEMSVSINQQQAAGAALSAKRGKTDPSELKGAAREMYDSMTEKQLRDFAKTKHEGLPEKVKEEMECDSDDKKEKGEEDPRSMSTKINLVKNKFRSMGLKMSYEPEGENIQEIPLVPIAIGAGLAAYGLHKAGQSAQKSREGGGKVKPGSIEANVRRNREQQAAVNRELGLDNSYEPEGEVLDELNRAARERGEKSGGNPAIAARNKPPFKYGGSRQEPKDPGKKPDSPHDEARRKGILSPLEHKVELRRAARKRASEFEMDTKGT